MAGDKKLTAILINSLNLVITVEIVVGVSVSLIAVSSVFCAAYPVGRVNPLLKSWSILLSACSPITPTCSIANINGSNSSSIVWICKLASRYVSIAVIVLFWPPVCKSDTIASIRSFKLFWIIISVLPVPG